MFVVYSKENCSQCAQAKLLLQMKSLDHTVAMLDVDFTLEELKELAPGRLSFPVITKDGEVIGGFAELRKLIV